MDYSGPDRGGDASTGQHPRRPEAASSLHALSGSFFGLLPAQFQDTVELFLSTEPLDSAEIAAVDTALAVATTAMTTECVQS